jgi:hypothetical protein
MTVNHLKSPPYKNFPNKIKTFKLTRRAWIRSILYSSVAVIGGAGYISSRSLEIVRQDVPLSGLSTSLDGLKIGVMSDFHLSSLPPGLPSRHRRTAFAKTIAVSSGRRTNFLDLQVVFHIMTIS